MLTKAQSAEELWKPQEAISNYQLAAKISKELGEFETSRLISEKAKELRRRMQLLKKKSLTQKRIRMDEVEILEISKEANEALQIATIAEEEQRWEDAIEHYQIVIQKSYEMGDTERAKAFEEKIMKLKRGNGNH